MRRKLDQNSKRNYHRVMFQLCFCLSENNRCQPSTGAKCLVKTLTPASFTACSTPRRGFYTVSCVVHTAYLSEHEYSTNLDNVHLNPVQLLNS